MNRRHAPKTGAVCGVLLGGLLLTSGVAGAQDVLGTQATLRGAGSTLAQPLMREWAKAYQTAQSGLTMAVAGGGLDDPMVRPALDYEAVGSQAGLQRLMAGQRDFAVSEAPLSSATLRQYKLLQVPVALSGIVVAVNLPGAEQTPIRLSGPALSGIFLGTVKTWNDPMLVKLNPQLALPAQPIRVIHRSDGSGTTYTFTAYLSAVSPTWKKTVGSDLSVSWPTGQGARGNGGVAEAVARTPYALGYLSYAQAQQSKLAVADLLSASGQPVRPLPVNFRSAAGHATWQAERDFQSSLVNLGGPQSYPLLATVYLLLPDRTRPAVHTRSARFVNWVLTQGQAAAQRLGFLPLPQTQVGVIQGYLGQR